MDTNLLKLDAGTRQFPGLSGKIYHVEESIPAGRWGKFQKLSIEVGYNIEFYDLFVKLKELYDLQNKQRFADASVLTHNLIAGVAMLQDEKPDKVLLMCSLFMNEAGEDCSTWSEDQGRRKNADWAHIDVSFFLANALACLRHYTDAYKDVSLQFLRNLTSVTEKVNTSS